MRYFAFFLSALMLCFVHTAQAQYGGQKPAQPAQAQEQNEEEEKKCPPIILQEGAFPDSVQKKYSRRQAEINAMDKNCDGKLQPDEQVQGLNKQFQGADLDGDGVISPSETKGMVETFIKEKESVYGSHTENRSQKLETHLKKMDANKDGQISAEEYGVFYSKRYKGFDKDGDGVLSFKEYETDVEVRRRNRD